MRLTERDVLHWRAERASDRIDAREEEPCGGQMRVMVGYTRNWPGSVTDGR